MGDFTRPRLRDEYHFWRELRTCRANGRRANECRGFLKFRAIGFAQQADN
jgi:hypothetical protein